MDQPKLRGFLARPEPERSPQHSRFVMKVLTLSAPLPIILAGAAVFFFGDLYNIAAPETDLPIVA